MPKLYITRHYRRDQGSTYGWTLVSSQDGTELAKMPPKWPNELIARESFGLLYRALTGDGVGYIETDLLMKAESKDV